MNNFLERLGAKRTMLLIFVVALLPYVWWLTNDFVSLDDGILIYANGAVQNFNLRSILYIFSSYDPELYIPLTLLSYQIANAIFGTHAFVFHLMSLLIHAGNAVLVFSVAQKLLKNSAAGFIAALLFALHPLQSESVYWASALKDVLSLFFFLFSIHCYLIFTQENAKKSYRRSLIFFFLGLLSKVTILTLPIILLLIDWYQGRSLRSSLKNKIPYFVLSIIFGIVAIYGKSQVLQSSSLTENMLLGAKSTFLYLSKLFLPIDFSIIYPQTTDIALSRPEFFVPMIGCALLVVLLILAWKKFPLLAFSLAFFFITIIPNFTNFNKNGFLFFASDRYAYVPFIAVFLLIGYAVSRMHKKPVEILSLMVLLGLGTVTYAQGYRWQNSETLYTNVLGNYPDSALARNNYADILAKQQKYDDALTELDYVLERNPNLTPSYLIRGNIFRDRGRIEEAMQEYKKAIETTEKKEILTREDMGPYYALADVLDSLGKVDESLLLFSIAAEKGNYEESYYNLGIRYQKYNRLLEAKNALEKAVELNDEFVPSHYNLAAVYAELGMLEQAEASLIEVYKRAPHYEKTREHLENIQNMLRSR